MLAKKGSFPLPGGTLFRLVQFPPKPPEGYRPRTRGTLTSLNQKIPGMASHFERDTPGMHTSPAPGSLGLAGLLRRRVKVVELMRRRPFLKLSGLDRVSGI